jgi:hypothetical protein
VSLPRTFRRELFGCLALTLALAFLIVAGCWTVAGWIVSAWHGCPV